MTKDAANKLVRTALLAWLLMLLPVRPVAAQAGLVAAAEATTNAATTVTTNTAPAQAAASEATLRSYLLIQEQLHNIERSNLDAEAAASRDAELLEGRLTLIEKSLASQRLDELKEMQRSNRTVLIANAAFALVAFAVLLFAAFLQWSAVNRLAGVAAALTGSPALGPGQAVATLGMGGAAQESTARLLGTIDRLEKRLLEMEAAIKPQRSLPEPASANGHGDETSSATTTLTTTLHGPDDTAGPETAHEGNAEALLGKGDTLLKLDQPEKALDCFIEALAAEPNSAEAMVRKGLALERLQRWEEAIASYDLAIATDSSMTMAYLYKGGVFNRLERYREALECYEKALKSQEKAPPAKVVVE